MSKQKKESALCRQVGGTHYQEYTLSPYVFFIENQIPHHKASIIRRILRYDHKTGKGLEDLRKIQHELELIIEIEGWEEEEVDGKTEEKEYTGDGSKEDPFRVKGHYHRWIEHSGQRY